MEEIITDNLKYLKSYTDKIFEISYDWNETSSEIA